MKPIFQTKTLISLLALWVIAFGTAYNKHLQWQMTLPEPAIDATTPSLAMVYWVYPPHANIAVLLNAMFNTPGEEGVTVYMAGGQYDVYDTPITLRTKSSLIGLPMTYFQAVGEVDTMLDVRSARDGLVAYTAWNVSPQAADIDILHAYTEHSR